MMESSLASKAGKLEQVQTEDVKRRHLSSESSTLPESQHSSVEEKEHLQVYLRIRPFTSAETDNGESQECVIIETPDTVLLKPPSSSLTVRLSTEKSLPHTGQRFQFSQVYGPEATQRDFFQGTVKDLVKDVLEGGNSLVFTYGVTNAGKTFTFLGPDADAGILPRSLNVIFSSIEDHIFTGMSIKPHRCQEFSRLTREQQYEEAVFKRNLFRQLKESEKSNISLLNSTNRTLLEDSILGTAALAEDKISLEAETHTKFSVWVSFCEIYNENIHDLLELIPSGALRRTALRLSQDVKGNAFVKDLRWVQVNSAEEAFKVMKLGKKNQSFSSTRLNQLSSRSHSIFSIRILRIEDIGTPRVHAVSELSLCDLAGSERCAKTQNKGERLKEAGNINTSLLILGKCINALRHNQQAKLLQHVPFRESKLTHYLQGFFCGRGKACMIVNINQCASMYDETLNVLKFSAVAQRVVVLSSRLLPIVAQRSEVSFIMNSTEKKTLHGGRRSSLIGWDSSLEDVQEVESDENEEEQSVTEDAMDQTDDDGEEEKILICRRVYQKQQKLLKQLHLELKKERTDNLVMEAQIREEISREFSELFSGMQADYNERLVREREIMEERAERRLEIFKNLIDKMAAAGPSPDTQVMEHSLDLCSSELAGGAKLSKLTEKCLDSGETGAEADRRYRVEELERKVLQLSEQLQGQMAHKPDGEAGRAADEEQTKRLSQLREKLPEAELGSLGSRGSSSPVEESSCERERLQEALAALDKEKRLKEDALAALSYQTIGKEEALESLEQERKAREEAVAMLAELKNRGEEALISLRDERKDTEEALALLEAERSAKEEAIAALEEEKQSKKDVLAALGEERRGREAAQSALEVNKKETSHLAEEREKRQHEADTLRQEVARLTAKLEAAEHKVTTELGRAEEALVQIQGAQAQLEKSSTEIQEKTLQIQTLTHELQSLREETQTSVSSSGAICHQLRAELLGLRKNLEEQKESSETEHRRVLDVEQELVQAKEQLEELKKHQQQAEELRQKLHEQDESSQQQLDQLRSRLERQEDAFKEELEQLEAKLVEQSQTSEKQLKVLNDKLREQEGISKQQLEELKHQLEGQTATSSKLVEDLKQKLQEEEQAAELLRAEADEERLKTSGSAAAEDELRRLNSDLQTEAESLRRKVSDLEETQRSVSASEHQRMLKEKELEEKLAELQKASAEREAEVQEKLCQQEEQVRSLEKSLQEARQQQAEEENQAVQEARRREVERRRELLAVAHEAIAQKDAELEKKTEEIARLKENAKQDLEKAKSLSVDLQRKEEESSDLKEKLADYKKQIQQVQKEISSMREEEKLLKQRLSDMEKAKKQLQCDVANRDRTIQQLSAQQSSEPKSDQSLELYQKASKDLEVKERVMEDMRLTLREQEETQDQMEQVLEEKLSLIQELSNEVEKLKAQLLQQVCGNNPHREDEPSEVLKQVQREAAEAQESLKLYTEKHQAERRKWMDEKLSLIHQAKDAEDKRNQDMRKFVEDRERYNRQQGQLESLSSQLAEKEQTMEKWRMERDTLVSALEVQLKKLLTSQAEKDQLIQQLRQNTQPPQESGDDGSASFEAVRAALSLKEAEVRQLKEELKASTAKHEALITQTEGSESPGTLSGKHEGETTERKTTRASVSSQGSPGCPSVLDASEISTENGRTSRFPQPELEISFSPLQPNRMALRRQGEENAVTVKISRPARKRKSGEMEKSGIFRRSKRRTTREEEVETENRRNTRTKMTPKLTPHQEELSSSAGRHNSPSSLQSKKEATLQKIGDFLQSSPTLLGSKAKKMMSLVSGRGDVDSMASSSSSSSLSIKTKKNKRKLFRPEISSPMDMPPHPIISREPEEKESDHQIIKWRLRSRMAK